MIVIDEWRDTAARTDALRPRVELLARLMIFANGSRPGLERLASVATEAEYPARAVILAEGNPADVLYVLAAGKVEVSARGEYGGLERHVRTMSTPSYFGEIGVLENRPHTATVRALTPCRCERIAGSALLEALRAAPASSARMETGDSRPAVTHPSETVASAAEYRCPEAARELAASGGVQSFVRRSSASALGSLYVFDGKNEVRAIGCCSLWLITRVAI